MDEAPPVCDAEKGPQRGICLVAKCMAPSKGCDEIKKEFKMMGDSCCPKLCNYVNASGDPCVPTSGKKDEKKDDGS